MDWTRRLRLQHLQLLVSLMETGNLSGTARAAHTTQPGLSKLAQGTGGGRRRAAVRASRPWPAPDALWHDPVQPRPARAHRDGAGAAEPRGDAQRAAAAGCSSARRRPPRRAWCRAHCGRSSDATPGPGGTARRHHERPSRAAGETPARCGGGALWTAMRRAPACAARCSTAKAIVVMARPGHPLAQAAALDWEDVRRYDWIVWPPGSPIRSKLDMALTQGGRQPPAYRLESSSMLANIELLRGSDMLSIGSARVVEHLAGLGLVARLALEIPGEGAVEHVLARRTAPRPCQRRPAGLPARRRGGRVGAPAGGCYCKKAAASRQCDSLSFMCRSDFPMSALILLSAHHRAMHALYSEHHGWLQNWLRGKLGCAADAADLAQDTFLRILLKRELREIGMPRAFLRTIARGLVIDHWRREELQRAYLEKHRPPARGTGAVARGAGTGAGTAGEISRMLEGLAEGPHRLPPGPVRRPQPPADRRTHGGFPA